MANNIENSHESDGKTSITSIKRCLHCGKTFKPDNTYYTQIFCLKCNSNYKSTFGLFVVFGLFGMMLLLSYIFLGFGNSFLLNGSIALLLSSFCAGVIAFVLSDLHY